MTIKAPTKDKIMPANFTFVNLSLKIKIERMVMTEGFKDMIIAALLAVMDFKPEKKKKLYPAIPVIPRQIINIICEKLIRGNLLYFLKTNTIKNIEAIEKRKKAEVKGGRFTDITLPATKVLPKNKVAKNSLI